MSLVAAVDGALCFVNQSQFVRLSVAEGSLPVRVTRRRVAWAKGDEGERGERDRNADGI